MQENQAARWGQACTQSSKFKCFNLTCSLFSDGIFGLKVNVPFPSLIKVPKDHENTA